MKKLLSVRTAVAFLDRAVQEVPRLEHPRVVVPGKPP
jgi:hypothetical protein